MDRPSDAAVPPEILATLVSGHRDFLAFLERRLGDRALAEDILQDAFVRGIAKLGTLDKDESATAWFFRILRNSVIDYRRRGAAASRKLEAFAAELETQVQHGDAWNAVCQCIGALASTLKPEYSDALRRVELDGVPVKDYATEAGITSNNAAVRLFRAREALRKEVTRSCRTCADHGCFNCTCKLSGNQPE
jgi:RNA polymerase sigma-70 factor (ECF subfamily)